MRERNDGMIGTITLYETGGEHNGKIICFVSNKRAVGFLYANASLSFVNTLLKKKKKKGF